MNIDFETMAILEEESQNDYCLHSLETPLQHLHSQSQIHNQPQEHHQQEHHQHHQYQQHSGSVPGSTAAGGETRKEGGKRGRRPGRKAASERQDMKAKLERSRQSARECRARKKLRYQYLEELVSDREKAVMTLRKELEKYYMWNCELDEGRVPDGIPALLEEMGMVKQE